MNKQPRAENGWQGGSPSAGPLLPEAHNGPEGEGGLGDPRYLNPGPVDPLPKTGPSVPPTVPAAPDGGGPASSDAGPAGEQDEPRMVDPRLFVGPDEPQK